MSEDALTDDLVRYHILSKVTPGKIVIVDELGKWDITEPSRFYSGMRSMYNLLRHFRFPPSQRLIFLSHLERTTNSLISHCDLQMQTRVFEVCVKQQPHSAQDAEKFDQIILKLKTICTALYDGMQGMDTLCRTTTYQNDVNFFGEVKVRIMEHVKGFFVRVANQLGPVLTERVLGQGAGLLLQQQHGHFFGKPNDAKKEAKDAKENKVVAAAVPLPVSQLQQQQQQQQLQGQGQGQVKPLIKDKKDNKENKESK